MKAAQQVIRRKTPELFLSICIGLLAASVTTGLPTLGDYLFTTFLFAIAFGCAVPPAVNFRLFGLLGRVVSLIWLAVSCGLLMVATWRVVHELISPY